MNLQSMNNESLMISFTSLVQLERKTTRAVVEHLIEIEKRRAYVELGYPNAIDWLVRHHKMSESSAWRRVNAARAIESTPQSVQKIESGVLNISTLAKTHSVLRNEEKRRGEKISAQDKAKLILEIESKTLRETEITLAQKFPDQPKREVVSAIDGDSFRAHVTLTQAQLLKVRRVREILSHRTPNASLAEILDAALDEFLKRKDPLLKTMKARGSTPAIARGASDAVTRQVGGAWLGETALGETLLSEPAVGSAVPACRDRRRPKLSLANSLLRITNAQCAFVSELTGIKCASKVRLQLDHIQPWARGGPTTAKNLRVYCQSHNLLEARKAFGQRIRE